MSQAHSHTHLHRFLIVHKLTYTPGPDMAFDCPKCHAQNVASTDETYENNSILWLIPLWSTRFTQLTCQECRAKFTIPRSVEEVSLMDPEELAEQWQTTVPFLAKACIVIGLVLCWVPFMGLPMSAVGMAGSWGKKSKWRMAAIVACVLSLPMTIFGIVMILIR